MAVDIHQKGYTIVMDDELTLVLDGGHCIIETWEGEHPHGTVGCRIHFDGEAMTRMTTMVNGRHWRVM